MKTVYVFNKVRHILRKVYTIQKAARAIGIHPKTLRRWEEKGKFIPIRTPGNQRRFTDKDLNLLAKLKAGEPLPAAQPRLLTLGQAAEKLKVNPITIQRWTKAGKLRVVVNNQLEPVYSENELNRILQGPTLQAEPEPVIPQEPSRTVLEGSNPWEKHLKYAGLAGLLVAISIAAYLALKPRPVATPSILEAQPETIDLALPRTAQFLDGRITLGIASGDLFYVDNTGNMYLKGPAFFDQGVFTRQLQLLPAPAPQDNQVGQLYVDQESGNLRYFDGLDWIDLNKSLSIATDSGLAQSMTVTAHDLDLTLGELTASASAASLRINLAGDQSMVKIQGGAGQDLLTINDDALFPITLSQPTQIAGNLYAPKLIDYDLNNYFLDPSSTTVSLSVAGDATISSTLTFAKNNEFITNSIDNYLTFSGGIGVGGTTSYGFSPGQNLNIRSVNVENELTVAGKMAIGTDINSSYKLNINGDVYVNGNIVTETNTYPDYVFEPDYPLLSPLQLKEFITTQGHLPGVPTHGEITADGLNLKQLILALLEKTEENTLYILDLYDRSNQIISPTVTTEVLTTKMISPLGQNQITITGDASVSGTLYAKEIDSSTIDRLKEKISALADNLTSKTATAPAIPTSEVAGIFASEVQLPASDSGHLALTSLEAEAAFFKDYLAVLGQTTLTEVTINGSLFLSSVNALNGSINFLAGLMTLDESGQVTVNGNLTVTGAITASQLNPLPEQELSINIASASAVSIYSDTGPVATFSGQTASFNRLNLTNSGSATISAGTNHALIDNQILTDQSQIVVTFTSDFKPATKYWVKKEPELKQFTVFVNYPVNLDTGLDWLMIN